MEKKVYRSRISVGLLLFVAVCLLPAMFAIGNSAAAWIGILILAAVVALTVAMLTTIRYIIDGHTLQTKVMGMSCSKVDIHEIRLVQRSYNPLSAPAASLKRLEIYKRSKFGEPALCNIISPVREKEFLERLKSINPAIEFKVNHPW